MSFYTLNFEVVDLIEEWKYKTKVASKKKLLIRGKSRKLKDSIGGENFINFQMFSFSGKEIHNFDKRQSSVFKIIKCQTIEVSIPGWVVLPSRERRLRSSAFQFRGYAGHEYQPIQP